MVTLRNIAETISHAGLTGNQFAECGPVFHEAKTDLSPKRLAAEEHQMKTIKSHSIRVAVIGLLILLETVSAHAGWSTNLVTTPFEPAPGVTGTRVAVANAVIKVPVPPEIEWEKLVVTVRGDAGFGTITAVESKSFVVTSMADSGAGTLREAKAPAGGTASARLPSYFFTSSAQNPPPDGV